MQPSSKKSLSFHVPVLADFIGNHLVKKTDKYMVDATLGEGGHSQIFLEMGKKVIAFDRDIDILTLAKENLSKYKNDLVCVRNNFAEMGRFFKKGHLFGIENWKEKIDFALFDLGISMYHYKGSGRGFSFLTSEPLNMKLEKTLSKSACDILADSSKEELADIFYYYGGEKKSRKIANYLVLKREKNPITNSLELADLVKKIVKTDGKTHPATRVFQALRIAVNDELSFIKKGILSLLDFLSPNGRLAVITYHSLEDKIVKDTFLSLVEKPKNVNKYRTSVAKKKNYKLMFKKPIVANEEEIAKNKSARSAKMRVLLKM